VVIALIENGMMEWWNNGILGIKVDQDLTLIPDQCRRHNKIDFIPQAYPSSIPAFQYSSIPNTWKLEMSYLKVL
jgi:hypothetical protein